MVKLPLPYSFFRNNRRGSAIIGALVMTAILALSIGIMLSSSRTAIQRSADRIAYEEAYQTALAGTHIARAWLVNPELAGDMLGGTSVAAASIGSDGAVTLAMNQQNTARISLVSNDMAGTMATASASSVESDLETIIQKAVAMNQQIMEDVKNGNYTDMYGPAVRFGDLVKSTTLSGGRKLVYNFPGSPIVSFDSRPGQKGVTFNGAAAGGNKSYVEWVRLTTPGTDNVTSASLRETTFIVEAKGVAEYAGVKKERVVQQRVLIKPNEPQNPLIGANEAILTQQFISVKGESSANIHWAPVLSQMDLNLDFISQITDATKNGVRNITLNLNKQKANIAGARVYESGNGSAFNGYLDEWLQYKTGVNGRLMAGASGNSNVPMFGAITGGSYGSAQEFDFFKELANGTFGTGTSINNLVLSYSGGGGEGWQGTNYGSNQTDVTSVNNPNGLFDPDNGYAGSLVQGDDAVDERVEEFFTEMSYDALRAYAEAHASYYTWDGTNLTNVATGKIETPTMKMANTSDPLSPAAPSDRILFVDSPAKSQDAPFGEAFTIPGFWKGVVYANGPMKFPGSSGAQTVQMRSPIQFQEFRAGKTPSTSVLSHSKVILDGIVICNGSVDMSTGGGVVYGTVAAKGGVKVGANFSIFYNPANGEGRLRDTSSEWQPYNLVAGKLYEVKSGGLTDS